MEGKFCLHFHLQSKAGKKNKRHRISISEKKTGDSFSRALLTSSTLPFPEKTKMLDQSSCDLFPLALKDVDYRTNSAVRRYEMKYAIDNVLIGETCPGACSGHGACQVRLQNNVVFLLSNNLHVLHGLRGEGEEGIVCAFVVRCQCKIQSALLVSSGLGSKD